MEAFHNQRTSRLKVRARPLPQCLLWCIEMDGFPSVGHSGMILDDLHSTIHKTRT